MGKNPLKNNRGSGGTKDEEARGGDVNGGRPSQEDSNWARENGRVRGYGGRRGSDNDEDDY